jgi:tRNA G46 methylase TrmB
MSDPAAPDEHDEPTGPPYRHIRSFAMRRGHITQGQRRAFEQWLPAFGVPYRNAPLDFAAVFGRRAPTVLEIGFGLHIYFPDPWQKKRHHKRRLIAQPFVGMLASRIAAGGYLHCATDWEDYALQMLEVLEHEPQLVNAAAGFSETAANPLCERPTTKFHARGTRLGHGTWDLVFVRR